jgi:hypothetical protein
MKKSTVAKINFFVRHYSWSWRNEAVTHFQAKQCQAAGKFHYQQYQMINVMHISAILSYLSLYVVMNDMTGSEYRLLFSFFIKLQSAKWNMTVRKRLIFNICHIWYITEHTIQNHNHKSVIIIRHHALLLKWKPIYGMQNVKSTIALNNFL